MFKTTVIGHLGQDARINDVRGKQVINFSVAHTEKWKDDKGTQQERTTWVNCAKWIKDGQTSKLVDYLKKGTQVYVEGQISTKVYQNQQGAWVSDLQLRIDSLELLGSAKPKATDGSTQDTTTQPQAQGAQGDAGKGPYDDLPF
jgi:single-strand DNA-binding protein